MNNSSVYNLLNNFQSDSSVKMMSLLKIIEILTNVLNRHLLRSRQHICGYIAENNDCVSVCVTQIDQEGLTLPERSLYLGQDEDSVKVQFILFVSVTPPTLFIGAFSTSHILHAPSLYIYPLAVLGNIHKINQCTNTVFMYLCS